MRQDKGLRLYEAQKGNNEEDWRDLKCWWSEARREVGLVDKGPRERVGP